MKKYGRTFHLPSSPGATSDDKVMSSLAGLMVADLVITEKMDGENTTIHAGGSHARSPDSRYHPSRDWLRAFAATIQPRLDEGERIVGENLYARHSVGRFRRCIAARTTPGCWPRRPRRWTPSARKALSFGSLAGSRRRTCPAGWGNMCARAMCSLTCTG